MAAEDPEKAMDVTDGSEEEDHDDEAGTDAKTLTSELLKNPAVMSALQGKLDSMVGTPSGYIKSLPAPVKRRLKALKKSQLESLKVEAAFYEEVHKLECKYAELYKPHFEFRSKVAKGDYEPTDAECEWPSDDEEEDLAEEVKLDGDKKKEEDDGKDTKGIPEFWLTTFKNVEMLQEMIMEHDEPILQKLTDVSVTFSEKPMGFTIHFFFAANDYFTNTELTKEYEMKCKPDEEDPFGFEGPEIFKCKGCTINWKSGKNVTVKTVKKKQKHKSKGNVRTVTKTVKNDSFFNFFDPPAIPDDPEAEVDGETQELLTADFELGHFIRERIVPRAVLYFTGEALDDDDYDEEDDEEEEDGEEGEEEEDDPDFDPSKAPKNQQECKQQ
jgi:nucleosome assembly protein 1-like 1